MRLQGGFTGGRCPAKDAWRLELDSANAKTVCMYAWLTIEGQTQTLTSARFRVGKADRWALRSVKDACCSEGMQDVKGQCRNVPHNFKIAALS